MTDIGDEFRRTVEKAKSLAGPGAEEANVAMVFFGIASDAVIEEHDRRAVQSLILDLRKNLSQDQTGNPTTVIDGYNGTGLFWWLEAAKQLSTELNSPLNVAVPVIWSESKTLGLNTMIIDKDSNISGCAQKHHAVTQERAREYLTQYPEGQAVARDKGWTREEIEKLKYKMVR